MTFVQSSTLPGAEQIRAVQARVGRESERRKVRWRHFRLGKLQPLRLVQRDQEPANFWRQHPCSTDINIHLPPATNIQSLAKMVRAPGRDSDIPKDRHYIFTSSSYSRPTADPRTLFLLDIRRCRRKSLSRPVQPLIILSVLFTSLDAI